MFLDVSYNVTAMPKRVSNSKRQLGRTFIREWREYRGLSLDRLVDRLDEEMEISKASLSRIERSLQPYTQPVLEALAVALNCQPADLIMRDPKAEEWSLIDSLRGVDPEKQRKILKIIKVLEDDDIEAA